MSCVRVALLRADSVGLYLFHGAFPPVSIILGSVPSQFCLIQKKLESWNITILQPQVQLKKEHRHKPPCHITRLESQVGCNYPVRVRCKLDLACNLLVLPKRLLSCKLSYKAHKACMAIRPPTLNTHHDSSTPKS